MERERTLPFTGSLPKILQQSRLGQAEVMSQEWVSGVRGRNQNPSHRLLPPRMCVSRKLDSKGRQDLNSGTLIQETGISSNSLTGCITLPITHCYNSMCG